MYRQAALLLLDDPTTLQKCRRSRALHVGGGRLRLRGHSVGTVAVATPPNRMRRDHRRRRETPTGDGAVGLRPLLAYIREGA